MLLRFSTVFIGSAALTDSKKLTAISDGFCNDLLLSTYSELGFPLDESHNIGYVTASVSYFTSNLLVIS